MNIVTKWFDTPYMLDSIRSFVDNTKVQDSIYQISCMLLNKPDMFDREFVQSVYKMVISIEHLYNESCTDC